MVTEQIITQLTLFAYTARIFLTLDENGVYGFCYRLREQDIAVHNSLSEFKTVIECAHAVIAKIEEIDNAQKEAREKNTNTTGQEFTNPESDW